MLHRMTLLLLTLCFASNTSAEDVPWLHKVNTPPQSFDAAADKASADGSTWEQEREQIRRKWNDFLGAYHFADLPLQLESLKEEQLEDCTRLLIRYQVEPGRMVRAYLLIPDETSDKPLPAIVAFHGTSATTFDKLVGLDGEPELHDHVLVQLQDGRCLCYRDPRRFGMLDVVTSDQLHAHPRLRAMGPDPLDPAWTAAALAARLRGRKAPIKTLLMDQRIVAGIYKAV